jgi:hypothetical protein
MRSTRIVVSSRSIVSFLGDGAAHLARWVAGLACDQCLLPVRSNGEPECRGSRVLHSHGSKYVRGDSL